MIIKKLKNLKFLKKLKFIEYPKLGLNEIDKMIKKFRS